MDPARKRTIRLVVALSAALLLAVALAYTSFSASSEATTPRLLASTAKPGKEYDLTGKVQAWHRDGRLHEFRVVERSGGTASVPVQYEGTLPDPFRNGREVIVHVRKGEDGTFVADKVTTKCPSKFTKKS